MSRLRRFDKRNRPGVVLLITLVLLVLLSMLAYTLSVRVSTRLHRDQYLIDYSKARYGCDSAVRYALATLEELKPQLISRPNDPDFSDIFAMSEAQYQEFLTQYGLELQSTTPYANNTPDAVTDFNDVNDANDFSEFAGFDEPDTPAIPGPYGPAWPFVTEPVELEIGSARVRIEIEDENAKYPIAWAMLEDDEIKREATAGFETFCEWTNMSHDEIDSLKQQLKQVSETKPFKLEFKPITKIVRTQSVSSGSKSSATRATRAPRVSRIVRKTISAADQIESQNADFAKLLHSSLIDAETLARPRVLSETRDESALKYMSMWATRKININSAPRHVLEAAFMFGGDQVEIADEIIQKRRIKPFADIEELRRELLRYSDSIEKCRNYITTVSSFFTIRVTAVSGVAKATTVIAITKDGRTVKRIAVISG